ncbi:methionyl-tRNA formyltransferase (plasmid) [Azospirillum sp. B510]|uniref:formyltransferase family protein n=1 Tax=Azospirillum sp. (strain B510) TaxID=137722 RepID=UPI0001C4B899|nr:formyltransferase family protein [Azospirillum sp. B510]BAI74133.1 methionyl-tRNA formyltransferase [Azospirillum sp. B510]
MKIVIAGQKWFGTEVFRALSPMVQVVLVSAPRGDRLMEAARQAGIDTIEAGSLTSRTMPDDVDLIVAAHSHDFISERTRLRARYGAIGYHPSLLPVHRGRDAIEWTIRMRDRITGGTVYRLNNRIDGGPILAQEHVHVQVGDTAADLWRRALGPLGVKLLTQTVQRFLEHGYIHGVEQDEALATWEPSIGRAPLHRPDLFLLEDLRQSAVGPGRIPVRDPHGKIETRSLSGASVGA